MFKAICLFVSIAAGASCTAQSQSAPTDAPPAGSVPDHSAHTSEAHGNHDPHHGGVVYMKDNLHFEIVFTREGTHRIYFSDAARAALPASTASEVTVSFSSGEEPREVLKADVDETGESWIANGKTVPKEDTSARVTFVVENEPYWIDVPFIEASPDAGGR